MKFLWKPHVGVPVSAQVAGERLEGLHARNNGRLTAKMVVDDARPPSSPLHPVFEWNDSVAAEKYREDQARYVLRSIVVVRDAEPTREPIRAFLNVERDADTAYTTLAHAMTDRELRTQVVQRAWKELEDWRERYREYEELAAVFARMDDAKPQSLAG